MKRILLLLALAASQPSQSQAYVGAGIGASIQPSAAGELHVGYNIRGFFFQGGYVTHINQKDPAIFHARIGQEIVINEGMSVALSAGYAYQLISAEKKSRNMTSYIAAVDLIRYVGDNSAMVFTLHNSDKYLLATIGFRYYFTQ